jgi:UDP-N-acetylglucosamine:LPS N-acetylglucosamine transferase
MHEWMVAADLLVSKPGPTTVSEAINCGLPLLALDPLPGGERRACYWIEKWETGYWVRRPEDLAPAVTRLLTNREHLRRLRGRALSMARPRAALEAAEAMLQLWQTTAQACHAERSEASPRVLDSSLRS